jgi:heptosyltransferase I
MASSPGIPPPSGEGGGFASGVLGIAAGAQSLREAAGRMPGGRFDLLLDLQVYFKAGLLTYLTPARVRLGFDRARARDLNWLFTTHRIPPHPNRFGHIQDQYFEFLRFLGVDPEPLRFGLELTEMEREEQRRFFAAFRRPPCALVLATSNPRKDWDPLGYAEVASRLVSGFGMQPILVGGTSAAEENAARLILREAGEYVLDVRGGGIRRLLWLLDGSELVISPDTGPLHMARAMETPVIGLFGFTNPKRSGPYRLYTELVVDGYTRSPGETYPVSMERRRDGMGRITPEMVLEKVALAREGHGRKP